MSSQTYRTRRDGWTASHDELIKLVVAFGEEGDYAQLVETTKLLSNGEHAFANIRAYAQDRKQAHLKSKKRQNWKEPQFDHSLYSVFQPNKYIEKLHLSATMPPRPSRRILPEADTPLGLGLTTTITSESVVVGPLHFFGL